MSLFGMKVLINPMCDNVQRMTVSPKFADLMPPKFVSELDAWMLEFFGRHDVTYQLGDTLIVGPKSMAKICEATR